jgi:hypothetical protein
MVQYLTEVHFLPERTGAIGKTKATSGDAVYKRCPARTDRHHAQFLENYMTLGDSSQPGRYGASRPEAVP